MTLRSIAVTLLGIGVAGLLLVPVTKSGLGSCGPYGALGFMTLLGPLLMIIGAAILATQFAVRLIKSGKH
jgi:hypothetical protein